MKRWEEGGMDNTYIRTYSTRMNGRVRLLVRTYVNVSVLLSVCSSDWLATHPIIMRRQRHLIFGQFDDDD